MVGDAQIGKTSLMVKYVEGSWDEDYIQTLGVNFMEKTISIRNTEITFSIWDLGGQREFVNMLPLVCNDAVAILFMFDLTRKSTLNSIKEWYRQGRGFNKTAIPLLVGTKYDHFVNFPLQDQEEISNQAIRFAKAMRASLIFSSTSHSINVQKIFKIVLSKAFDLKCTIPEIENVGEPLLLFVGRISSRASRVASTPSVALAGRARDETRPRRPSGLSSSTADGNGHASASSRRRPLDAHFLRDLRPRPPCPFLFLLPPPAAPRRAHDVRLLRRKQRRLVDLGDASPPAARGERPTSPSGRNPTMATRVGTAPMSSIERHVEGRARPTDRPKGAAVSPSCECSSSSAKVRVFIEAGFVVTVWFPHPRSGKKSASQLVHGAGKEMSFRPSQVKPMAEPVT
ncbi:hypothetical protein DCS_02025 [Drechmeria coniospora]|uniref:Septum-promoting GTP-binding protein 1 n=1 Tax=Drechmeria coniospora TaxID=98403 RepID=A0A151GUU0_DRECN|nr:hypothetical protein DCS_02025 [Drechmeria coniospora]KYK60886.1 hypothetical protein DCS_02025 [Drechmeria coniospora]